MESLGWEENFLRFADFWKKKIERLFREFLHDLHDEINVLMQTSPMISFRSAELRQNQNNFFDVWSESLQKGNIQIFKNEVQR